MLFAEIIHPKKFKRKAIKCKECGLTYPKKEYSSLFSNYKLKYFYVKDMDGNQLICHNCLFDLLKRLSFGEPVKFVVVSEEHEYIIEFYPENYLTEFLEGENEGYKEEDSMDDFLRDLE